MVDFFLCLLFFWKELERQVRIEGLCERVSPAESDAYFNSRPEGSRIGAWASPQSRPIDSREVLDRNIAEISERFQDTPIYRPPHWGGYRLNPVVIEFWQGRQSRLHDRIRYDSRDGDGWKITRLAPWGGALVIKERSDRSVRCRCCCFCRVALSYVRTSRARFAERSFEYLSFLGFLITSSHDGQFLLGCKNKKSKPHCVICFCLGVQVP